MPVRDPAPRGEPSPEALHLRCCHDDQEEERETLDVPRGSSCCGARLPASVGDPSLTQRMAAGMLSGLPPGQEFWVRDPVCGAHLYALGYAVRVEEDREEAG